MTILIITAIITALISDSGYPPGALNPAVTQATIHQTICVRGWTATIRPPATYTDRLKREQMRARGLRGPASAYEEDHYLPLELGGHPINPMNLWPQPLAEAKQKDRVEDAANKAVCQGRLTLDAAQKKMRTNWRLLGRELGVLR